MSGQPDKEPTAQEIFQLGGLFHFSRVCTDELKAIRGEITGLALEFKLEQGDPREKSDKLITWLNRSYTHCQFVKELRYLRPAEPTWNWPYSEVVSQLAVQVSGATLKLDDLLQKLRQLRRSQDATDEQFFDLFHQAEDKLREAAQMLHDAADGMCTSVHALLRDVNLEFDPRIDEP